MKKHLLIMIVMLGAMFEASAMISPEERAVPSRQGFRYSKRSIIVNEHGQLVIPKWFFTSSHPVLFDEKGNFVLDKWLERNDLPSNLLGGRPYGGGDQKTGQQEYDSMVEDLKQAEKDEDKINELRKSSKNQLNLWETVMIFDVCKEKAQENIRNAFSAPLDYAYNHELDELRDSLANVEDSLENVRKELKNNSDNKKLIDQERILADHKEVVKFEIKSFQHINNRDSFYRSSMTGKNFELFQQCRAAQPQSSTRE